MENKINNVEGKHTDNFLTYIKKKDMKTIINKKDRNW